MNCDNCGVSVNEQPLYRVNPKGEKGVFWCQSCIDIVREKAFQDLNAMSKDELMLVPHEKVRWVCAGKGCKRSTGISDFGLHPIYWHRGLVSQPAGFKHNWVDTTIQFFMCPKHSKMFNRLKGKFDYPHIERRIFDFTKNLVEKSRL